MKKLPKAASTWLARGRSRKLPAGLAVLAAVALLLLIVPGPTASAAGPAANPAAAVSASKTPAAAVPKLAAAANAPCILNTCNGLDPQHTGCSADAQTLETVHDIPDNTTIQLRFSPSCLAAWSRITTTSFQLTARIEGANCPTCSPVITYGGWIPHPNPVTPSVVVWSDMVSWSYWVRACDYDFFNGWDIFCTSYH